MKKLFAGVAVLVACLLPAMALANPPRDNKNGPHKDYVSGTVQVFLPTPLGSMLATSSRNGTTKPNGHSGDQAEGTWSTDFFGTILGDIHLEGTILCINAIRGVENAADWRGVVTGSNTPLAPVGAGVMTRDVDNGGGPPDDPPDRTVGFLTPPPGPNPSCPATGLTTNPVVSGDLVVHDGGF